jgi:hypothetical protein
MRGASGHSSGRASGDRNRHGDCPRAIRLHLGDQSRAHGTSAGVNVVGGCGPLESGGALDRPQPLRCNQNQGDSRRHQSCRSEGGTTAGEFLKPIMWLIIRSTPDARPGQPQTKKRKCGIQPAHQSLFTDVFGSRLLLCTIHQCKNFTMSPRGDGKPCAVCLTGDIRMGWSGRRPAVLVGSAWPGRRRQRTSSLKGPKSNPLNSRNERLWNVRS